MYNLKGNPQLLHLLQQRGALQNTVNDDRSGRSFITIC